MANLIEALKQVATEAVAAENPTSITYGNVISDSPLTVQVNSKLILDEDFLVLTKNVSEYEVDIDISFDGKEGPGLISVDGEEGELDNIQFKGKIKINNALEVGDKVIMIQIQGGQKYVVLDKLTEGGEV